MLIYLFNYFTQLVVHDQLARKVRERSDRQPRQEKKGKLECGGLHCADKGFLNIPVDDDLPAQLHTSIPSALLVQKMHARYQSRKY